MCRRHARVCRCQIPACVSATPPHTLRTKLVRCGVRPAREELILLNCKQRLTAPTLFLLTGKSRAATSIARAARERPNQPNAEPVPLLGYALRANPTYRTARFHWRRFPRAGWIGAGAVKRLRRNCLCHSSGGYELRPNRPYVVFIGGQVPPAYSGKKKRRRKSAFLMQSLCSRDKFSIKHSCFKNAKPVSQSL